MINKLEAKRVQMNLKAQQRAGAAASNVLGSSLDLALNTGLALATRSPLAVGLAAVSAAVLVNELFF